MSAKRLVFTMDEFASMVALVSEIDLATYVDHSLRAVIERCKAMMEEEDGCEGAKIRFVA